MRYIPLSPIPLKRLIEKWGKPAFQGTADDNFQPVFRWPHRGIEAFSIEGGNTHIVRIDYEFTQKEIDASSKRRSKEIESALKRTKRD